MPLPIPSPEQCGDPPHLPCPPGVALRFPQSGEAPLHYRCTPHLGLQRLSQILPLEWGEWRQVERAYRSRCYLREHPLSEGNAPQPLVEWAAVDRQLRQLGQGILQRRQGLERVEKIVLHEEYDKVWQRTNNLRVDSGYPIGGQVQNTEELWAIEEHKWRDGLW